MLVEIVGTTKIVDAGTVEFTVPLPAHATSNSRNEEEFVLRENPPEAPDRTSSEILPGVAIGLR